MPQIGSFVSSVYREESRTTGELIAALCKAQMEFGPVALDEDGYRGGHAYKYASIHSIRKAIQPAMSRNGLIIHHIYGEGPQGEVVVTVLRHTSGEYLTSVLRIPDRSDVQDAKAVRTLLCRTAIEGLLGIVTEQDDDGQSASEDSEQSQAWHRAYDLARTAILSAPDLPTLDRYHKLAEQRIAEGQMAPESAKSIASLVSHRKAALAPKEEVVSA